MTTIRSHSALPSSVFLDQSDVLRDFLGAQAIERLVALMDSENESVAVRATEALLDRVYGRPMLISDYN
jgi:hypothetical protein